MMRMTPLLAAAFAVFVSGPAAAQDFSEVEIRSTRVADGVWAIVGAGGNIGVVEGEDGVFVIDDQYAPLTEQILDAIRTRTHRPVRFVFNTHWHGDHTGGNENMDAAGAVIVAHDNVRRRLSEGQFMEFFGREVPPAPAAALPVVTFSDEVTFHLGGHTVNAWHVPNAHTDGDAVVHLREANVIHAGDLVFYGMYPFIDYDSGGSLSGLVEAVEAILARADGQTAIIVGHGGPVIDRDQLAEYRDLLATVHERLSARIAEGQDLQAIQAAGITAEFDERWGGGFIGPERWIEMNFLGMTAED